MEWYYARNGEQQGPVEIDTLKQLVADGGLVATDLVWNQTMGKEWQQAGHVEDLFSSATVPVARPPVRGRRGRTNAERMEAALESLRSRWGVSIGASLIAVVITSGTSSIPFIGIVATLLLEGPMRLGVCSVYLTLVRRQQEPQVEQVFHGFRQFGKVLAACLLSTIFVLLWALLLIIPGIMAALSYSQLYYILADNPAMNAMDAITASKKIMKGHRWELCCLHCRFLGWLLLALLTCGIGLIWLIPYIQTSLTHFYEDIREKS